MAWTQLIPFAIFSITRFSRTFIAAKHESRHVGSSPSQKYICLDVQDSIVGVCSIGEGFSEGSAGATLGAIAGFVVVFTVEGVDEDAPSPGSDESFAFFLEGPVESVVSVVAGPVDPDDSADEDYGGPDVSVVSVVAGPVDPDDSADEDSGGQMNL